MNVSLPTLVLIFCLLVGRAAYWTQNLLHVVLVLYHQATATVYSPLFLWVSAAMVSDFSVVSVAFSLCYYSL